MSISRRSFLKMAGLTTVAVAGASLFASCTVASYLQIEFTDDVYNKLCDTEQNRTDLKKVLDYINAGLMAMPLVGVESISKDDVMEQISNLITAYYQDYKSDKMDEAQELIDMLDVEADKNGNIKCDGNLYAKILVKVTVKK